MRRRTFLMGATATAVGLAARAYLGQWRGTETASPEPLRALLLSELEPIEYDVCVIGSGPAGAVVAADLVQAGKRVVVLESGTGSGRAEAVPRAPLDTYASLGELSYPLAATKLRGVGGTSIVWSGRCPRLRPGDFAPNPLTPEACPWPLRYADLEPYYERAERTLGVAGGRLSASHAPRRHDLPDLARDTAQIHEVARELGIAADAPPLSVSPSLPPQQPRRFRYDAWPALSTNPRCDLVEGATVARLRLDARGRIEAAECFDARGRPYEVTAATFVVACGGTESARLLLLSASSRAPDGLGNGSGELGRNFMEHPWLSFVAEVPLLAPFRHGQLVRSYQLCEELRAQGHGGILLGFYGLRGEPARLKIACCTEMKPSATNRLVLSSSTRDPFGLPGAELTLSFSDPDARLRERAEAIVRKMFEHFGTRELAPEREGVIWSHHHMGATRMGADPRTAVVDPDLRVHGTTNLYVASSSTFVTSGVGNPTLTIVALSHRLAEHLLQRG